MTPLERYSPFFSLSIPSLLWSAEKM